MAGARRCSAARDPGPEGGGGGWQCVRLRRWRGGEGGSPPTPWPRDVRSCGAPGHFVWGGLRGSGAEGLGRGLAPGLDGGEGGLGLEERVQEVGQLDADGQPNVRELELAEGQNALEELLVPDRRHVPHLRGQGGGGGVAWARATDQTQGGP